MTARLGYHSFCHSRVPLRLAERAQIIQKAADGMLSQDIARMLNISRPTVQLWRHRFFGTAIAGTRKTRSPTWSHSAPFLTAKFRR
ncbi:MAG: helix-turn-helix domain-containing protein [Acidobacteriia bacterium]|nr:helix-turn-helix domain-containing protein [Terriglobia bacterium]